METEILDLGADDKSYGPTDKLQRWGNGSTEKLSLFVNSGSCNLFP